MLTPISALQPPFSPPFVKRRLFLYSYSCGSVLEEDAFHVTRQEDPDPRRAGGAARAGRLRDRPSHPGLPLPGDAGAAGQSFAIQAADPDDRGGLEFARYADIVRRHLLEQGYSEAPSAQSATPGRRRSPTASTTAASSSSPAGDRATAGFGYGGFGYRPYWSRFGGYGRLRSPFYYGWDDPFWWRGYGEEIDVYTVYTSYPRHGHQRAGDGESVFEGTARARSRTDELGVLVPNLVEAMFTGFPGNSGETVKITVAPRAQALTSSRAKRRIEGRRRPLHCFVASLLRRGEIIQRAFIADPEFRPRQGTKSLGEGEC